MTETIYQVIRRLVVDDGLAPEVAAQKAIDGQRTRAQLAAFVMPEVVRLAMNTDRRRVSRLEHQVFDRHPTPNLPEQVETRPEAIRRLVQDYILLPDGRKVRWGQATVDDHLARAGWLRRDAANLSATATRHETAAKLIKSHKATCLDEIDGWGDLLRDAA